MMFILLLVCVFCATTINAFTSTSRTVFPARALQMKESSLKKNAMKIATGLLSIGLSINTPAYAATYGGFGAGSPEVLDPKTAVVNQETYKSDEVKGGIEGLAALTKSVGEIKASLKANGQLDFTVPFKAELSRGKVRNVLNAYNTAFEEDTQRGTDRLIRAVIQDVTELDRELQVKPGKARSATKVEACLKRLGAAEKALNDLAAFYPK
jgi:hypothetical protein